MSFIDLSDRTLHEPVPGYHGRFIHSDNMTLAYWDIEAGAVMPEHSHPHEQVYSLIEGEFELTVEAETRLMKPGQVAVIPSNLPHAGRAITPCRVIDVFHPVREDYK